jgi:hypothetical protein
VLDKRRRKRTRLIGSHNIAPPAVEYSPRLPNREANFHNNFGYRRAFSSRTARRRPLARVRRRS